MFSKIKTLSKKILSNWYRHRYHASWSVEDKLKVLIEVWPGFTKEEWIQALNNNLREWDQLVEVHFVQNSLERHALAPGMDIYVSTWLTNDLLAQSLRLRWVHLTVAGVEFLDDLDIPTNLKITTAAGVAADGIAEHVIGLMIALDRRFNLAITRQLRWKWDQVGILGNIRCLRGLTVGIIGLGHNGQAIAKLSKALGLRVIGLDKRIDLNVVGVAKVYAPNELSELLEEADFVTICVPLTKETKRLIAQEELRILGSESYLINVARGEIVDEEALAWALRNKVIAGAGLDVLSGEPPSRFHPLQRCPNLIITPHVAGNIYTFRNEIKKQFVCNLKSFITNGELEGLYEHV